MVPFLLNFLHNKEDEGAQSLLGDSCRVCQTFPLILDRLSGLLSMHNNPRCQLFVFVQPCIVQNFQLKFLAYIEFLQNCLVEPLRFLYEFGKI